MQMEDILEVYMKKFISLCLIVFVIFSACTFTVGAQTGNLLTNGGFENGNTDKWMISGPACKVEVVPEAAHSGKYGVSISERTGKYSTMAQDIYETYYNNGEGKYKASVWIKLTNAVSERIKCQLVISYTEGGKAMRWITSRAQSLTTDWQEFVIETDIKINVYDLESMLIYPQVESASSEKNYDFCFDDMTFVKVSEVIKPDPNYVDKDIVANAKTPNLIENGDFETGDEDGADVEGSVLFEFDKEYARTGEYGMLVTDRSHKYSTVRWDLRDIYWENGPGQYRACVFIRLNVDEDATEEEKALETVCEFVIRYGLKGDTTKYIATGKKKITTKWTKIVLDRELDFDPTQVRSMVLYPQVLTDNPDYFVDFCVDDVTLYKTTDVIAPDPNYKPLEDIKVDTKLPVETIDVTNTNRDSGPTTVGVIRWDAWYGSDGTPNSVISAVEKTLSPAEFHFRAPFFAEITADNKIIIPEYTQEIFDQEMEYAAYAGIDYFAYIWYADGDETNAHNGMQKARKFHQTSQYRNDVKMCIIDPVVNDEAIAEMSSLLTSDYYMTVLDGRPLMYYILSGDNMASITEKINIFKNLAQQLGVKEPYAVIMNPSARDAKNGGASAVSKYAIAGTQLSFDELTKEAENVWNEKYTQCKSYFTQFQFVPTVTYGWHPEPRYINPVTWMTVDEDNWCEYATDIELLNHLAYAMSYIQHPSVKPYCEANTVIAYAWNEHDEGGWICPTLAVDENGNQLYNEDGSKKINEGRINATRLATDFIKAGNLVKVTVGNISNGATALSASQAIANAEEIISGVGTFKGARLNIGTSLTLDYFVKNIVPADNISVRFTNPNGNSVTTKGVLDKATGYLKFSYTGINPQCMADTITAELMYNDYVVKTFDGYSVKQYCDNIASKSALDLRMTATKYNDLKMLMADMLNYGSEAQKYANYNILKLANNSAWVSTCQSTFSVPIAVREISGNQEANNCITTATLNMANVNKIRFKFKAEDETIVKLNGAVIDKTQLSKSSGVYTLYTEDIFATDFDQVFTLDLIKDGVTVAKVKYNVNAYIVSKYQSADIVKALSQYGTSAEKYATYQNDGNFDFNDTEAFPTDKPIIPDGDMTFGDSEIF